MKGRFRIASTFAQSLCPLPCWGAPDHSMGAEPGRLCFCVTGFGDFRGVTGNPTEYIVQQLEDYLDGRGKSLPGGAEVVSFVVLKVAGREVQTWLAETSNELLKTLPEGSEVIWVHFGVDVHATEFKLEARAKNEASFRTPDEDGWQPRQQQINAAAPLGSWLHTDLPLHALAASLAPAGLPVSLSGDAGLFVCNFTYYCSLRQAEAQRGQQWHSLFVHVPPFEVIPAPSQLRFAASLLDALAAMLSPGFAPFSMHSSVLPTAVA